MSSRIALVTGGNTGLGYATILSLLNSTAHAYTVILGSRSLEKGQEAARQLLKETTNKNASEDSVFVVQIDIESDESVDKAFEVVKEKYGRVDVLINNAGKSPSFSLESYSLEALCSRHRLILYVADTNTRRGVRHDCQSSQLHHGPPRRLDQILPSQRHVNTLFHGEIHSPPVGLFGPPYPLHLHGNLLYRATRASSLPHRPSASGWMA